MAYAVLLDGSTVVQQIKAETPPPGWIETADKVAIGSTYAGGVFTPPPPPPPPTPAELEAEIQEVADSLTSINERDKAIAMVIADVVAKAFNIPTADARQMVRDRLVDHLRTIKGI